MGQEDFDLACPTQSIMQRMIQKNLLLPMTAILETTNYLGNLSPFMLDRLDDFSTNGMNAADYALPYMWGTSGILYNTKFISADEAKSWGCMWDPKNKGKMLMKDSYPDAYNMAAVYGYRNEIAAGKRTVFSVTNDHTEDDFSLVEKQLKELKTNVAGWEADFGKEMMTKGEKSGFVMPGVEMLFGPLKKLPRWVFRLNMLYLRKAATFGSIAG